MTSLVEVILMVVYLDGFLGRKALDRKWYRLSFGGLLAMVMVLDHLVAEPLLLLSLNLAGIFLISLFLYQGSIPVRIFTVILFGAGVVASEIITMILVTGLGGVESQAVLSQGLPRLQGMILSKLIQFFLVKLACRFKTREYGRIPLKYWLVLLMIPVFTILVMHGMLLFTVSGRYPGEIFAGLSSIGILYINIIIFAIFERLLKHSEEELRYTTMKSQLDLQIQHYKNVVQHQKEIRSLWHDLNNHLAVISAMAAVNKTRELIEYVSKISRISSRPLKSADTGSPVMDSLLDEKIQMAKEKGIDLQVEPAGKFDRSVDPVDLCIILGNALDNAIEACMRIQDPAPEKRISLAIRYSEEYMILYVTNPTDGKVVRAGNSFITTKEDTLHHGFGLDNIENTVKKYNGNLEIGHKGNTFTLVAALKIPAGKQSFLQDA